MTSMTPFQVAQTYLAMKMHFTSDNYDIIKYRGKVKISRESFEKRKDKHRLEKISRDMNDADIVNMFAANFIAKSDYAGLFDEQTEVRYKKWKAYRQSLSYNFRNEVRSLFNDAKDSDLCYNDVFFSSDSNQHPPVFTSLMGKEITFDTFVILDRLNKFTDRLVRDVVTEDILRTAHKYSPFLRVDTDSYQKIVQQAKDDIFGD